MSAHNTTSGGTVVNVDEWGERRRHKRLLAKESVSAFCRTPAVGIAILMDIGVGGVAFQYTQDLRDSRDLLKDSIKLDLFKIQPFHSIAGIECEVVYDTVMPWQVFLPDTYQLRRCGVEFSQLSEDQHRRLDSFIKDINAQGA
jgi:c-di-GMP-binding flagellar brake protein YcgR